jgi:hypothetical protein
MSKIDKITNSIQEFTPYLFIGGAAMDFYLYRFMEGYIQIIIFSLLLILNKLTRLLEIHKVYIEILRRAKEWAESKKKESES